MNNNSVVLGYPYWNAFYWLCTAEGWRGTAIKEAYAGQHPYYKNLYNVKDTNTIDEVASMCLLFDKVILSPVDCWMPDQDKYRKGKSYNNTELGIYSSWEWRSRFRYDDPFAKYIIDNLPSCYSSLFPDKTKSNMQVAIIDMLTQILLANNNSIPLVVGKDYLDLYRYLGVQLHENQTSSTVLEGFKISSGIKVIQKVTGLQFGLESFEDFCLIRCDEDVRRYGDNLKENLIAQNIDPEHEKQLLKTILEVTNKEKIGKKINKGLDVSSTILGLAGIIPILGNISTIGGLTTDVASKALQKKVDSYNWWTFFPKIGEKLSLFRIEKRYKELEKEV